MSISVAEALEIRELISAQSAQYNELWAHYNIMSDTLERLEHMLARGGFKYGAEEVDDPVEPAVQAPVEPAVQAPVEPAVQAPVEPAVASPVITGGPYYAPEGVASTPFRTPAQGHHYVTKETLLQEARVGDHVKMAGSAGLPYFLTVQATGPTGVTVLVDETTLVYLPVLAAYPEVVAAGCMMLPLDAAVVVLATEMDIVDTVREEPAVQTPIWNAELQKWEMPVEEPVALPAEEPVEAPVAPPVEAPPVEAPVAPPVEAPVAPPVEEPVAPPVEEPVAPPVEEPVAPPVEAPVEEEVLEEAPTHTSCGLKHALKTSTGPVSDTEKELMYSLIEDGRTARNVGLHMGRSPAAVRKWHRELAAKRGA